MTYFPPVQAASLITDLNEVKSFRIKSVFKKRAGLLYIFIIYSV